MSVRDDIQSAAEADRIITGVKETVKHAGDLERIIVAENTPTRLRAEVEQAADEHDVPVDEIDADNRELGSLCMKPYTTSVIGIT